MGKENGGFLLFVSVITLFSLVVSAVMGFALSFFILKELNASSGLWTLFWIYIVVAGLSIFTNGVIEVVRGWLKED